MSDHSILYSCISLSDFKSRTSCHQTNIKRLKYDCFLIRISFYQKYKSFIDNFYKLETIHDFKCQNMMETGHWVNFTYDEELNVSESPYTGQFKPELCNLIEYNSTLLEKCFESKGVTLIGDSRTRQLFSVLRRVLEGSKSMVDVKIHSELVFRIHKNFRFLWSQSFTNGLGINYFQKSIFLHCFQKPLFEKKTFSDVILFF